MQKCGSCKFYLRTPLSKGEGECHAKAPTLTMFLLPQGPLSVAGWPTTKETNECGEGLPKIAVQA